MSKNFLKLNIQMFATATATSSTNSSWVMELDYSVSDSSITVNSFRLHKGSSTTSASTAYGMTVSATCSGSQFASQSGLSMNVPAGGSWSSSYTLSGTRSGLSANTTYAVSVSMSGSSDNNWRGTYSFSITTSGSTPSVNPPSTSEVIVSNLTETSVTLSYTITSDGGAPIQVSAIDLYSEDGTYLGAKAGTSGTFTGLTPNTRYYGRSYVTNGSWTHRGAGKYFTTYNYPYINYLSNWTIGNGAYVSLYNPLGHSLTVYLRKGSQSGTLLGQITTTSTSASDFDSATTELNSLTGYAYEATAVAYMTYNGTTTSDTATYSIGAVQANYYKKYVTEESYTSLSSNFSLKTGDSVKITKYSNPTGVDFKYFIATRNNSSESWTTRIVQDDEVFTMQQISGLSAYYSSDSGLVRLGVQTIHNGYNVRETYLDGTMTILNDPPTFEDFDYKDENTDITAITGDDHVLIQGLSVVDVVIPSEDKAIAKEGGTMLSYSASIENISTSFDYSDDDIVQRIGDGIIKTSGLMNMSVTAYENRGFNKAVTKQITVYPYLEPTNRSVIERKNGYENETTLNLNGTYSIVTVNNVQLNAVTNLRYRYKLKTVENYGEWANTTITLGQTPSGEINTWKATDSNNNNIVLDLDSQSAYNIQLELISTLGTYTYTYEVPVGQPIVFISSTYKNVGIGKKNELNENYSLDILGKLDAGSLGSRLKSVLLDLTYPVGSLYMSKNSTSPSTLFGGTWERVTNDYLLNFITSGDGGTYTGTSNSVTDSHTLTASESGLPNHDHEYRRAATSTEGHTLTTNEMPSHTHSFKYYGSGGGGGANGLAYGITNTQYIGNDTAGMYSTGGDSSHYHSIDYSTVDTSQTSQDATSGHTHNLSLKKLNMYGWIRTA